jgi:DNA polymerase III epsilon subunit-like protein
MREIKTLVYFDLEATGLRSSGRPRISELSFVAVSTQDVLDLNLNLTSHLKNSKTEVERLLPRVMNKLTLCVYPMATIRPEVSTITGLDNYNLTGQAIFDRKTGELLNSFLARLPPPVCLVAHNGDLYDFPLLKAEMDKAGTSLLSEILCADSYIGIKEIFKRRDKAEDLRNTKVESVKDDENVEDTEVVEKHHIAGEFDNQKHTQHPDEVWKGLETEHSRTPKNDLPSAQVGCKRQNQQIFNSSKVSRSLKFSKHDIGVTPTRNSISDVLKAKKKLNFFSLSSPTSFSLINLHSHLLGCYPVQSHGAEADCLALLRTTAVLGKDWIEWVQDNCYEFIDCKGMWRFA